MNRKMLLKEFMVHLDEGNILEVIPTKNAMLSEIQKFSTLNSVTMALQKQSADSSCVRVLFEEIKRKMPELDGSD